MTQSQKQASPRRGRNKQSPPRAFSIDKYADCARLTPEEWGQQIAKRLLLQTKVLERKSDLSLEFDQLLQNPLEPFPVEHRMQASSPVAPKSPIRRKSIAPIRLKDLTDWTAQLDAAGINKPDSTVDQSAVDRQELQHLTAFGRIQVDMAASDEALVRAFRYWLAAYRLAIKRPSLRRHKELAKELNDWHLRKVLPYKDLLLWSMNQGTTLAEDVLVEALFSRESPSATTRKLSATKSDALTCFTMQNVFELLSFEA